MQSSVSAAKSSPVPFPMIVEEIQENVDAHMPRCKYPDLYEGIEQESLDVPKNQWDAYRMIESAAAAFENEFTKKLRSRNPKNRAAAAALRASVVTLNRAYDEISADVCAKIRNYFDELLPSVRQA